MRKIVLATAAAIATMSLAACSGGTEENAEATMDSMAADAETNMDAIGNDVEQMGAETGAMVDEGLVETEAELQDETVTEAAVD